MGDVTSQPTCHSSSQSLYFGRDGRYALSGKATAFAGPFVLALMTQVFESQRAGMASILAFFIVGLILLQLVQEPSKEHQTQ